MINEDELITRITTQLKNELPEKYLPQAEEFSRLVDADLMRASYDVLDNLRRKEDWKPSKTLEDLIREYQVVF